MSGDRIGLFLSSSVCVVGKAKVRFDDFKEMWASLLEMSLKSSQNLTDHNFLLKFYRIFYSYRKPTIALKLTTNYNLAIILYIFSIYSDILYDLFHKAARLHFFLFQGSN